MVGIDSAMDAFIGFVGVWLGWGGGGGAGAGAMTDLSLSCLSRKSKHPRPALCSSHGLDSIQSRIRSNASAVRREEHKAVGEGVCSAARQFLGTEGNQKSLVR